MEQQNLKIITTIEMPSHKYCPGKDPGFLEIGFIGLKVDGFALLIISFS